MNILRRTRTFVDVEQMQYELTLLGPITPGDVLVFRGFDVGDDGVREEIIEGVIAHYKRVADVTISDDAVLHVPLMVFLGPDQGFDAVDENNMREMGWVRA